jgi:hypothetical protein
MPVDLSSLEERLNGILGGDDLLAIYLQDHLAGSTFGTELARRIRNENEGTELGEYLARVTREIEEDRAALTSIMDALDVHANPLKNTLFWTAEKALRLKPNGSLTSYTPLSRVLELESLISGVNGKLALWQALRVIAERDTRLDPARLDELAARATAQEAGLREHQRAAAKAAFAG